MGMAIGLIFHSCYLVSLFIYYWEDNYVRNILFRWEGRNKIGIDTTD